MSRRFGKVEKLPSGRYRASFTTGGQRVRSVAYDTSEQAEDWLTTQRADLLRGTWAPADLRGRATLGDYATEWLTGREDLKPRTVELYDRLLTAHIVPTLGNVALRDLTPAQVRSWHAALGNTTGPTARAQAYRLLRAVLNQAVRDQEVTANPCHIRGAGTPRTPERPAPSLPQVHALADKVPARYSAMVLVAAYGGLRFGELTALTRPDVGLDEAQPVVAVRKGMNRVRGTWLVDTPKTAASLRTVTLPAFLGPILTAHLDEHVGDHGDALVFGTRSGRPLAKSNWSATYARAREAVGGLDDSHFHDLRHAAATLAVQNGATLKDTMARLGHASPRAALIYQHTARDRDEAIARALDQAAAAATAAKVVPLRPPA